MKKSTRGKLIIVNVLICLLSFNCHGQPAEESVPSIEEEITDTATFAGGCFWCIEASFDQIEGVIEAVSGYSGGKMKHPSYEQVASGKTDHAETVQVYYNRTIIDYETLLAIFFVAHDPTQLNRQGPDVGKQYRSVIFYHNEEQRRMAEEKISSLNASETFDKKIITVLSPFKQFYKAEDYHQNYEQKNPEDPYIQKVSKPKINKVREAFGDHLK